MMLATFKDADEDADEDAIDDAQAGVILQTLARRVTSVHSVLSVVSGADARVDSSSTLAYKPEVL